MNQQSTAQNTAFFCNTLKMAVCLFITKTINFELNFIHEKNSCAKNKSKFHKF